MKRLIFAAAVSLLLFSCTKKSDQSASDDQTMHKVSAEARASSKGIGPVKEVKLEEVIDSAMADKGKAHFDTKCSACHKFGERYVGPDLKGVTERRTPEWIMNMILNPVEMTQKDEQAKELLGEYLTQMSFQNVTEEEARQMLEFFRLTDKK